MQFEQLYNLQSKAYTVIVYFLFSKKSKFPCDHLSQGSKLITQSFAFFKKKKFTNKTSFTL
jgi:hypothetical protein